MADLPDIRIRLAGVSTECSIVIGGLDISHIVRRVVIDSSANEMTCVWLELVSISLDAMLEGPIPGVEVQSYTGIPPPDMPVLPLTKGQI